MMSRTSLLSASRLCLCWIAMVGSSGSLIGQERSSLKDELHRIFEAEEYETESFGPAKWLDEGAFYTILEPSESVEDAKDIIRYETSTGNREVLVDASRLVAEGETKAFEIDDYAWSKDKERLLVFTNTKRVWRRNTRGDYWVLQVAAGQLKKVGGEAEPSTLMFAKFSPDGARVAYVRENDLFVEDIESGVVTALTSDGSETVTNGTSDWVYEEEFDVRDGFRWSPDGERIAFWSFDSSGVGRFALINNTETLYPEVTYIPYPKVGTTNSAARIGVVSSSGGEPRLMAVPGDERDTYVARMEWAGDSETLVLQHLNRLQNTNDVLLADVHTGRVRRVHRDRSDTWVDVMDDLDWSSDSEEFAWLSEKDGWRHAYTVRRDGTGDTLITRFEADVMDVVGMDASGEWLYFTASPENATERHLHRARIDSSAAPERVSPLEQPGSHSYDLSPNGEWAFHTYSRFDTPPVIDLVRLPEHESVRVLVDNARLVEKVSAVVTRPVEFFQTEIAPGVRLDSWMLKPSMFDPGKGYPLLVFVYGEPAGTTVVDRWGGQAHAVPSSDRRRGLRGRQLRESRHSGTERRRLAQDDLRDRG